jgi:hypothetical protein
VALGRRRANEKHRQLRVVQDMIGDASVEHTAEACTAVGRHDDGVEALSVGVAEYLEAR